MNDYVIRAHNPIGDVLALVEFECANDVQAIRVAVQAQSPYGHDLWHEQTFLGWFPGHGFDDAAH
jgi:hypothetical protein